MFTGIVRGLRRVASAQHGEGMLSLVLALDEFADGLQRGASVAVNGVCLTATDIVRSDAASGGGGGVLVSFHCMQETLDKTNLGTLKDGDSVNVERALRVGDEIGGHNVTGHVDLTGTISRVERSENNRKVWVKFNRDFARFVLPKGWICLDGVSLTVVDVQDDQLSVSLIPETLAITTLGAKGEGDVVNMEFSEQTKTIVATVERLVTRDEFRQHLRGLLAASGGRE